MKPIRSFGHDQEEIAKSLRRRIEKGCRVAVVGIGDELSPADQMGMLAAQKIESMHIPGLAVFFSGTVPESMTGPVREFQPDHVILLDAADIGASPGSIRLIEPGKVEARLFSTHAIPLSVLADFVEKDTCSGVTILGVQPDLNRHVMDLSDGERERMDRDLGILALMLREQCNR